MNMQMKKIHPLFKIINNSVISLPTPNNISLWWNYGSLLGLCLMIQIITGLFLTMHYSANISLAFESVVHISRDVNYGWLIRVFHSNGASMFFLCLYTHIGRGIYYHLFKQKEVWLIGVLLMFLTMATAFMGYVLPWGQMSFWGATVITNLLSAIPYIGDNLVKWVWGGFAIENATLTRFLSFHFILPFIISAMVLIHLLFLHQKGSNNPLGMKNELKKIQFNPYFSTKDLIGFVLILKLSILLNFLNPFMFMDPDNFNPANPIITPIHIKPEWYFLFAYAILRSIPSKFGGVIALFSSISVLFILPFLNLGKMMGMQFCLISKIMFWSFVTSIVMLTWIGACPVEYPYIKLGQISSLLYFSFFMLMPIVSKNWTEKMNLN